jgi:hypothetical protein
VVSWARCERSLCIGFSEESCVFLVLSAGAAKWSGV